MAHKKDGDKDTNTKKRLLIVEDDTGVSSLVSGLVKEGGFEVNCCEDGERALELMRKTKYDVVYLGILMPKINSLDVLKTIQKDKIPHGKILIVTALNADVTINMILNLGASAYIDMNKITIEQLADRLKLELYESDKKNGDN